MCKDDGIFPNSPLYVLIYKEALELPEKHASGEIKDLFKENNWKNSWKDGIYDYHHYHSITHEVLAVYSGTAIIQLGGPAGVVEHISRGDVIIVPAGVAHKSISSDEDFKCVGAYPGGSEFDIMKGDKGERPKADEKIAAVRLPDTDPVYGSGGILNLNWEV